MSVSPFRDTVTLWHGVGTGSRTVYFRYVIGRVKCTVTERADGRSVSELYIPIYGKRNSEYVEPSVFPGMAGGSDVFTVSAGDRFIYGTSAASQPPDGAMTAISVTQRASGSRRLHHLEVHGEVITDNSDEGGAT